MGVNLKGLFEFESRSLSDFSGRKLAVDAYNTIYQFLSTIRQYDGTPLKDFEGRVTSHLSGIFYRNINLLVEGVKPVYVFDGKPSVLKASTLEARKARKMRAREQYETALERGDFEIARSKASQTAHMDAKIVGESKELLSALGIPVVQALSEGEAQSAYLVREGLCYATASQDYDSLLFGTSILVRNINSTGRRKLPRRNAYVNVHPEEVKLSSVLNTLGLDRDQLILVGMLCGTDFNNGVKGVGPKTALKKVKEYRTFDALRKALDWHEEHLDEVFDLFRNPRVLRTKRLPKTRLDAEKVLSILVDKHDFSEDRVKNTLNRLNEQKRSQSQKRLFNF